MENTEALFSSHIAELKNSFGTIFTTGNFDAIIIHSGTSALYYSDDQEIPFRPLPHFRHLVPGEGPNHILIIRPNDKPELILTLPEDYWYEHKTGEAVFWEKEFAITKVSSAKEAWDILAGKSTGKNFAFIGDTAASGMAAAHNISIGNINPRELIIKLDELRTVKTDYEVACIETANKVSAEGHRRAYDSFFAGGSELDIHHAFLMGAGQAEYQLPYPAITALDEKASVLHYQNKRKIKNTGGICLIDAGVSHNGYPSDITRTWASPKADGRFVSIISALDILQQGLCAKIKPGAHTLTLHYEAHLGIAKILKSLDLIYKDGDEAISAGVTATFFPHGLGHFLGLQVHDVGVSNTENTDAKLAELFPKLRTVRTLEPGNVITVEPGIYFIPMLLKKLKDSPVSNLVNWDLVQALTPCGGVRIEDDVLVTKESQRNLTRPYFESLDK